MHQNPNKGVQGRLVANCQEQGMLRTVVLRIQPFPRENVIIGSINVIIGSIFVDLLILVVGLPCITLGGNDDSFNLAEGETTDEMETHT